jgi:PAS domain S-box-containing protein
MPATAEHQKELFVYRSMFERAMIGASQLSLESRVLWANSAFAAILGYAPEDVCGKSVVDLTHPEDLSDSKDRIRQLLQGQIAISVADRRYLHKNGHYVWVNITATVTRNSQGEPQFILGLIQDFTERKQKELALRESEEKLDAILNSIQDLVWSYLAKEKRLIYVNAIATKTIYHREQHEFYANSKLWAEVIHPEDRSQAARTWERLAENGSIEDVYRIVRPCGEARWVHSRAWVTRGTDKEPIRFEGVLRDITEIKQAEIALRESEARLQMVMETGLIGTWELNMATGETLVWSKVFREICGFSETEKPSTENFQNLIHPADRDQLNRGLEALLKNELSNFWAFRIVRPNGDLRWVQTIGRITKTGSGENARLVGALIDITAAKESELIIQDQRVKMAAAAKMSALGEMAGGLAHEINNPVAIIHGNATMLQMIAARGELTAEALVESTETIKQTAERIAKITQSLLAFARDGEQDAFQATLIKTIIDGTIEFCKERFRSHGVKFTVVPFAPELEIECRPVQISQVLLNLLNNARDAIDDLPERWISVSVKEVKGKVELRVSDSGLGIPSELREKIFQPFFTTKEVGRGTGLGLSVANGIVANHNGSLHVDETEPNTCFVATLPIIQKK